MQLRERLQKSKWIPRRVIHVELSDVSSTASPKRLSRLRSGMLPPPPNNMKFVVGARLLDAAVIAS
jgi:hypothetical protein